MKLKNYLAATITIFCLSTATFPSAAETLEEDFATICGWYKSLTTEAKFKNFSLKNKFTFVFDPKIQSDINNIQLKNFYAALRTTQSNQRYELIKAYAEGTLGKSWECPPMEQIMNEFNALDPYIQYKK
jgi:hypothetical protein